MFGFDRGSVVELGVQALVVSPPHLFQSCELDLLDGAPRPASTDQLGLVERVDGLGHRVIVRITNGPCRGNRAEFAIRSV